MPLFLILFFASSVTLSYIVGQEDMRKEIHNACVAKYASMPHNQVDIFCSNLLKFKKDE